MDGQAVVEVRRRASPWRDRARSYRIFIDRAEAGTVGNGSVREIPVGAGPHEICLRIDWCRSPAVGFDVRAGEVASFRCGPNAGSWRVLYDATLGRKRYIMLERS